MMHTTMFSGTDNNYLVLTVMQSNGIWSVEICVGISLSTT